MRARFAVEALLFIAFAWATSALAHDIGEVRDALTQQGFDQLEFSRTKPPFKLDACRGGERFHLHVDFYGKILEQTPFGSCGNDAAGPPAVTPSPEASPTDAPSNADAPSNEGSSIASPAVTPPPKPLPDAKAPAKQPPAKELCARYFPGVGKTLRVPCAQ